MNRLKLLSLCLLAGILGVKAQVGYQIALLNSATGEARANETVSIVVSLTNNEGEEILNETRQATTNDFGVLSLSIGNANTFANADLSKMPFFIEASADGVMIGKSQILSVPVAEVAKRLAAIDKELIVGTWTTGSITLSFNSDGTGKGSYPDKNETWTFTYELEGKTIYMYDNDNYLSWVRYFNGSIFDEKRKYSKQ